MTGNYKVITLCGSTRFKFAQNYNLEITLPLPNIVLCKLLIL